MNKASNESTVFVTYNAPGASDFHAEIVESLRATGKLPEELDDVLTATPIIVDGALRWIVNAA